MARAVLVYIDSLEAAKAEEAKEARVQGHRGGLGWSSLDLGNLMDFDPCFVYFFVYYTVMTGSEDQRLDLSI